VCAQRKTSPKATFVSTIGLPDEGTIATLFDADASRWSRSTDQVPSAAVVVCPSCAMAPLICTFTVVPAVALPHIRAFSGAIWRTIFDAMNVGNEISA
jgi:hypothetical protein